jgi:hypothetical protein
MQLVAVLLLKLSQLCCHTKVCQLDQPLQQTMKTLCDMCSHTVSAHCETALLHTNTHIV